MVVADGAAGGHAEKDLAEGFRAVAGVEDFVFLVDDAAFVGRDIAAVEAGGDFLFERGAGQQIAGELLDRELVEGHVLVEGFDDPIAIGPDFAEVVEVDAVGVGVAGDVEPVAAAVLAPLLGVHEAIDEVFIGLGVFVVDEGFDEGGIGRQAGEVEAEAAGEGAAVGFGGGREAGGFELGQDEGVDGLFAPGGVFHFGRRGPRRRDEGPVGLILGAFGDPALEGFLLSGGQLLLRSREAA